MSIASHLAIAGLLLLTVACTRPPVERDADPSVAGKAWLSTDASAPPGTIRVFLPDGTLLMDSCGETYRLARWKAIDAARIEWDEDGARIEAAVRQAAPDVLELTLQLKNEVKVERYRLAQVPYVCPDSR